MVASALARQTMKLTSRSFAALAASAIAPLLLSTGCAIDKADPDKGIVDESSPPGTPGEGNGSGKADAAANQVSYRLESPHPYANNFDRTYTVDVALPSCASQVRIHFSMLRTEANYDYVYLIDGNGDQVQAFDGNHDNVWSAWMPLGEAGKVSIQLVTDYSIVRDGFTVDLVEWDGHVICPLPPDYNCGDDAIDLRRAAPACGCIEPSHCTPLSSIEIGHSVGGGFTGQVTGKKSRGTDGYTTTYMPATGEQATHVGTIDRDALRDLASDLATSGVLYGTGRNDVADWTECFTITTDQESIGYCAQAGSHTAQLQEFMARFDALFTCTAPFTCDGNLTCRDGDCVEDTCTCTQQYDPVCASNGHTFSNACFAGCAGVDIAHIGECGIAGDACGTIFGLGCQTDFRCRYDVSTFTAPYPDAGGTCVAANYCDAPADCDGLIHITVPGSWACNSNQCSWQTGLVWQAVNGYSFATPHPYGNNVSTWSQLYLPSTATQMRLVTQGTFDLEQNYDYLEVWTWKNGAWTRVKRYTGTTGPALTDVFPGRYHYLHFVSDSSVTRYGFSVTAEYNQN